MERRLLNMNELVQGKWPLVSVVIPTRDRPELLRGALNRIMTQNYPGEIECLVVFDQSQPVLPPIDVAERRYVRALVNQRTPGLAGARNTGAMEARGELLGFCDDDDEWLPDKLRLQVEALNREKGIAVATCGIYLNYGQRTVTCSPRKETIDFRDLLRSREKREAMPSTIIVRRDEFLNKIGLVDEAIPGSYGEDYEWLLRAARVNELVVIRQPLVVIRRNVSSWFTGRWKTIILALTYLLEKYPEFRQEPRGLARIYGQIAYAHAASGQRKEARRWARECLALNRRELRAYFALLISFGLLRSETVVRLARLLGKGVS